MKNLILLSFVFLLFGCREINNIPDESLLDDIKSASVVFPEMLPLPDGFQPEGIAIGNAHEFYAGSIISGQIYKGNIQTGEGEVFVVPANPMPAGGLSFDARSGYLFVANGMMGAGSVYDTRTGEHIETLNFTAPGTAFINDVVVSREAAYFTSSLAPVIYKVPLQKDGELCNPVQVVELALTGDFNMVPNPMIPHLGVLSNGIDATPNGKYLILASTDRGEIYRVDPISGEAVLIDLAGMVLPFADGILLDGKILYVVQNLLNQIAVIEMDDELISGNLVKTITNPHFGIPTTIAEFGNRLYAVNAHFDLAPPGGIYPEVEFEVIGVDK